MDFFDVDEIVGKRVKNGTVEYKVKWLGFASKFNQWIAIGDMKCEEKIKQYESSCFRIIGAKMLSDGVAYALFAQSKIKMVLSSELLAKFPETLVKFLEDAIVFSWPSQRGHHVDINNMNNAAYISACTNQGNEGLKYLLSVDGNQFVRVMSTNFALEHAADLLVAFLESKLDFNDCHKLPNEKCYVTRGFQKQVAELDIKLYPKVKVERSLVFERHLLAGPQNRAPNSGHPNQVRRTLPSQQTSVPIGARGRKRKTIVLLFVGCAPNPDGRLQYATPPINQQASVLVDQQPSNLDNRQVANDLPTSPPPRQPAKRTYARASSTPYASMVRHRPRGLSFPAPDELVTDPSPNESSIDIAFGDFGRLHYDTSDTE